MEKAHKIALGFFAAAIIVIAVLSFLYVKTTGEVIAPVINESTVTLYYGVTCPHCKVVEEYLTANNASSKIEFEQKEVFENKTNADELRAAAEKCGLELSSVGVPFLYTEGKCYIGDKEAISFFETKLKDIK